ncbi:MAG: sirohydrochlorin cobaltochelatase [Phascolarctobacterium sp.]|nr:sirohydrochlorin cobaltochelatase [Phascolarctobacterium sp.]
MTRKKAMLVISFGSTYAGTRSKDIGGIEQALAGAFPDYDQYRAFTSNIIRRNLAGEHIIVESPQAAMEKLRQEGYDTVILQPTHLLHGEEFEQKILTLKDRFRPFFKKITISRPLIDRNEDYPIVITALQSQLPALGGNEGVVFMGHGSPRDNNRSFGRTYNRLQEIFDQRGIPALVGTVEEGDSPAFADVLEKLKERGWEKVHLFPLMVVAGNHATNDMYGDDGDSWKSQIEALGIKTEGYLCGIGRNKAVQALYVTHSLEALTENSSE